MFHIRIVQRNTAGKSATCSNVTYCASGGHMDQHIAAKKSIPVMQTQQIGKRTRLECEKRNDDEPNLQI